MLNVREIFHNLIKSSSSFSCVLILSFLSYYLFFLGDTGGPQIVCFCAPREPYYLGTDLVLKLWFMTFGFSKSPFLASFQAILIFETKKVIIWFHFETLLNGYLSKILTSLQDFRQFSTYKSIHCIIFGYKYLDFCNNHQ